MHFKVNKDKNLVAAKFVSEIKNKNVERLNLVADLAKSALVPTRFDFHAIKINKVHILINNCTIVFKS